MSAFVCFDGLRPKIAPAWVHFLSGLVMWLSNATRNDPRKRAKSEVIRKCAFLVGHETMISDAGAQVTVDAIEIVVSRAGK